LGLDRIEWRDRTHVLATAATVMRQVLIDEVRRAKAMKRGGREHHTRLTSAGDVPADGREDIVDIEALDAALTALHAVAPDRAHIVELRYFAGLTVEEIATHLDVSDRTIKRQWRAARLWLLDYIRDANN
jgi:RNA polymerase sigma factor (TIGR02999 family)